MAQLTWRRDTAQRGHRAKYRDPIICATNNIEDFPVARIGTDEKKLITTMNGTMNNNTTNITMNGTMNSKRTDGYGATSSTQSLKSSTAHTPAMATGTTVSNASSKSARSAFSKESTQSKSASFDHKPSSPVPIQPSSIRTSSVLDDTALASGNDFIDDGYNEVELDTEVPHTLFDGGGAAVFGRDKELETLRAAFDQMVVAGKTARRGRKAKATASEESAPEPVPTGKTLLPAVFVWGISGTGKSKLVDTFCNQLRDDLEKENRRRHRKKKSTKVIAHRDVHILKGKFEEHQQGDPFSAITQALSNWCKQLASYNKPSGATAQDSIPTPPTSTSQVQGNNPTQIGAKNNEEAAKQRTTGNPLLQQLRTNIKSSLLTSQQRSLLLTFVPALSILFSNDDSDNASPTSRQANSSPSAQSNAPQVSLSNTSWNRFQYTFAQFLSAVSSKDCPVVMVLDDLQWASQECMELMSSIMHRSHFMWIGTIRQEVNPHSPDEVLELEVDMPFRKLLADINLNNPANPNTNNSNGVIDKATATPAYTDIHLNNFDKQQLRDWVSQLFQQDNDAVDEATDLLFRQTDGNIFHTVQLLEDMERSQVLVYSRSTFQWEMNTAAGASSNDQGGTDNGGSVVEYGGYSGSSHIIQLISSKLRSLPTQLQMALVLASYIRSSFELELLQVVWDYEQQHNPTNDILGGNSNMDNVNPNKLLVDWLEQAVLEGLLANSIGGTSYRFTHDRIQQASRELVPFGEVRTMLRLRIGECLWNVCTGNTSGHSTNKAVCDKAVNNDNGLIFIAADHLNCTPSKDHMSSTRRNLVVGEHALHMSALVPAATYLELANTSLRKVRGDPWQDHYDLTLRLLRARCDVELSLNRYDLGYSLSDELLKHARSVDDKLPTYAVVANALGKQNEYRKSLELNQRCALLCGAHPKRAYTFHAARGLISARAYFRRTSNEQFFQQNPVATDARVSLSMVFLRQAVLRGFECNDAIAWILAAVKMIQITRQHGICEESSDALAAFALLHQVLGDTENARRYTELAKEILGRMGGDKKKEGWIRFVATSYVDAYFKPSHEVAQTYQLTRVTAMAAGDFEVGFLLWNNFLVHAFFEGYPFGVLVSAADSLLEQMQIYKITAHKAMIMEVSKPYRYMSGALALNWEELMDLDKCDSLEPHARVGSCWARLHIAVYFGKYEYAERVHEKLKEYGMETNSFSFATSTAILHGMMASNRYRQTKQRKYLRTLAEHKRKLKHICETKGNNAYHRYLILRAERKSIKVGTADHDTVASHYGEAIARADAGTYLQEAGYACELAGNHFLRVGRSSQENHDARVRRYFTQALGFYESCGAEAKCADFRATHAAFIDEEEVSAAKQKRSAVVEARTVSFGDQAGKGSSANGDLASARTPMSRDTISHTLSHMMSGATTNSPFAAGGSKTEERASGDRSRSTGASPTIEDDDLSVLTDMS